MPVEQTGFWVGGINSRDDPAYIGATNYAWSVNSLNRGGIIRTRPGFTEIAAPDTTVHSGIYTPQGIEVFTPINSVPYMVVAFLGDIWISPYPFGQWSKLRGIKFVPYAQVVFEKAMKGATTNDDGTLTFLDEPYPVLIMQDGQSRAAFWDGSTSRHLDPTPINVAHETPIGSAMCWSGNRLWVGNGRILRASNLDDPLKFTEEDITAQGGFFVLPDKITGIGQTPDLRQLLSFTSNTTTTFQSGIFDRKSWSQTPDFQKFLFRNIGCVSHKSISSQYGMTWWASHNGLVALDTALQTYRTSRIHYRDQAMMRSKIMMSRNMSGTAIESFGNFLLVSVPSGGRHNRDTWVMDQTVLDAAESEEGQQPAWASNWIGIRPVQWVTEVINGEQRCFALSRDYVPNGKPYQYRLGIWEAFQEQRADSLSTGSLKRITCGFETRVMVFSAQPKRLLYAELDVSEIVGTVNVRIYYAGRRGCYKPIGSGQIVASQGNIGSPELAIINLNTNLESYRSQERIVRSNKIEANDTKGGVQSEYISSVDRGFSIYVEWDGEMALRAIRIFTEDFDESKFGGVLPDENTYRYVDKSGDEKNTTYQPSPNAKQAHPRAFIASISAKISDPAYSSR